MPCPRKSKRKDGPGGPGSPEHQATNLGVRGSNPFGRAKEKARQNSHLAGPNIPSAAYSTKVVPTPFPQKKPPAVRQGQKLSTTQFYAMANCITTMGWLRFGLELEDELAVETAVRVIRSNHDIEALRRIAEQSYRAWCTQADISRQLMLQLAEAERRLAQHEPVTQEHLDWAREITASLGVEQPARRSWFRRLWPT